MSHPYLAKVTRMTWKGREVEERVKEEINGRGARGNGGVNERREEKGREGRWEEKEKEEGKGVSIRLS